MLFHRVVLGEHVEDFALVHALFDSVGVALFLHLHDLLTLDIEDVLAALQGCLELALLLGALAKLPLALVHQVLLEADRIKFRI